MIRIHRNFTAIIVALFLVSCYPNQGSSIEELDLVVTYHNDTTNFSNYSSYILADTVVYITEDGSSNKLDANTEAALINKVNASLFAYNWIDVKDSTNLISDVLVLITVLEIENYAIYSGWWGYWGGWSGWGGYYPGYPGGGYYPGYPGGGYYPGYPVRGYTYSTGTVLVEMVNPNIVDDGDDDPNKTRIPILWAGIIDGLAEGSRQNVRARINEGVDIMFEESPYLKK